MSLFVPAPDNEAAMAAAAAAAARQTPDDRSAGFAPKRPRLSEADLIARAQLARWEALRVVEQTAPLVAALPRARLASAAAALAEERRLFAARLGPFVERGVLSRSSAAAVERFVSVWVSHLVLVKRFLKPDGTVSPHVSTEAADLWGALATPPESGVRVRHLVAHALGLAAGDRRARLLAKKEQLVALFAPAFARGAGPAGGRAVLSPEAAGLLAPLVSSALARVVA